MRDINKSWPFMAILFLVWSLSLGCAAKTHEKAAARLDEACRIYLAAEGLASPLEAGQYIKNEKLADGIELARRINRSACWALAQYRLAEREIVAAKAAGREVPAVNPSPVPAQPKAEPAAQVEE